MLVKIVCEFTLKLDRHSNKYPWKVARILPTLCYLVKYYLFNDILIKIMIVQTINNDHYLNGISLASEIGDNILNLMSSFNAAYITRYQIYTYHGIT